MRDIKFRAWDAQINKYRSIGTIHITGNGSVFMLTSGDYGEIKYQNLKDIIIEQYTGLKDSKGREIYEGDILEYFSAMVPKGESPYVKNIVKWQEYQWVGINNWSRCEVIGNIHENPELLQVKQSCPTLPVNQGMQ